jgi:hypothetical protein
VTLISAFPYLRRRGRGSLFACHNDQESVGTSRPKKLLRQRTAVGKLVGLAVGSSVGAAVGS